MSRVRIAAAVLVVAILGAVAFLLTSKGSEDTRGGASVTRDTVPPPASEATRPVLQGHSESETSESRPGKTAERPSDPDPSKRTLVVNVRDPAGRPVGGAGIRTERAEVAATDAAGRAELGVTGDAEGVVGFEVRLRGYVPVAHQVELYEEKATNVSIVLTPGTPVSGRVVDSKTGLPIEGAQVRVGPLATSQAPDDLLPVLTGSDGTFEWPGARDDETLVVGVIEPAHLPGNATLEPGSPRTGIEIALGRGAHVTGVVRGLDGAVLPHAKVWLAERFEQGAWSIWTVALDYGVVGKSDEEGRFAFTAVAFSDAKRVVATDGGFGWGASGTIVLTPSEPEAQVEVRLAPRGSLVVRGERPDGAKAAASVVLSSPNALTGEPGVEGEWSDSHAWEEPKAAQPVRFDGVLPGTWRIQVDVTGAVPVSLDVVVKALEVTEVTVRGGTGETLLGDVVDSADRPVAGAFVEWRFSGSEENSDQAGSATTDAQGKFRIENLQAVAGRLHAFRGRKGSARMEVRPGGPPIRVRLLDDAKVVGRLIFPPGIEIPRRVSGIEMTEYEGGGRFGEEGFDLDPEGRFEWTGDPTLKEAWLLLRAEGFAPVVLGPIRPTPGVPVAVGDHRLDTGFSRRGRIVDRQARPLAAVEVAATIAGIRTWDEEGAEVAHVTTRPDGTFVLERLPTGVPLELRARKDGYLPARVELASAGGELVITLELGAYLAGRVTSPSGKNPSDLTVHEMRDPPVEPVNEPPRTEIEKGSFRIGPLAPGRYRVMVYVDGLDEPVEMPEVTLVGGETREVEWRVP